MTDNIEKVAYRLYLSHMEIHGAGANEEGWAALTEQARRTYRHSAKTIIAAKRRGDLG